MSLIRLLFLQDVKALALGNHVFFFDMIFYPMLTSLIERRKEKIIDLEHSSLIFIENSQQSNKKRNKWILFFLSQPRKLNDSTQLTLLDNK